jgi:hypothetical protein
MISGMDMAVAEVVAGTGQTAGMLRINTVGMAAKKIIAPRPGQNRTTDTRIFSPITSVVV